MRTETFFTGLAVKTVAVVGMLCAGAGIGMAQSATTEGAAATATATSSKLTTLDMAQPKTYSAEEATFSSSSADNEVAANIHSDFLPGMNAMQYGSRTGRPRYRGSNRNTDGTPRWGFFAGVGFTAPITDESNFLKTSWAFQAGVTRNFTSKLAVDLQFDYDNFGQTGNSLNAYSYSFTGDPTNGYGIDGNTHIWSFTVNPRYTFYQKEKVGAYFVMGAGFYHKETSFFVPVAAEDCYYYCYSYTANQTIQNYTSNSIGASGGFGLTYKLSHFSNTKLYAEGRIVHTFNNFRPGADGRTDSYDSLDNNPTWNRFPQNSLETTYIPVKFGIRF
ncbi:MAG: hypothetical protein PW792_14255 [Acidobacteriaceae bacterium]|nr:hypothetical protein [Acidobacteriaceae bacterium]